MMSKDDRMQADCAQYTEDISLLQSLRKSAISVKMVQDIDHVLDMLLRVLMALRKRMHANDTSLWGELSTVRHQMRARVKRIQQQVFVATKDAIDVPTAGCTLHVPEAQLSCL
jgi:hypothetical protein